MAAFDRIETGIKGLDNALDSVRIGDNVVWQVSDIEEYLFFVKPMAEQAIKDQRNLVYMRFAHHKPLLEPQPGLKICHFDAKAGFESFTVAVHEVIEREGRDAFYIFDSLSELQAAWSADLMMGNFFVVTCPYLFELDTVAYFGIIRGRHSFDTIARIRETTQLLLDVFTEKSNRYIHPIKVWKRYSNTMFLPHRFDQKTLHSFTALTDGLSVSKFYALVDKKSSIRNDQNLDSWDRFFLLAKLNAATADQHVILDMAERLVGREVKLSNLVKKHFDVNDFIAIKEKMIGSGNIGGKATGMLLSRKIVENKLPALYAKLEPHDSFYIGSDVFYTYIVQNDCWKIRLAQMNEGEYFTAAKELKQKLLNGKFPDAIREQFRRLLEYYGQSPIIVRSSSLLEDSFGNAFAGKYESVFCVNNSSLEERLLAFENAVKTVYASTMDESALEYRLQRGLNQNDEQMAILVQRVSGSVFCEDAEAAACGQSGKVSATGATDIAGASSSSSAGTDSGQATKVVRSIFMPCAAGVGFSYNSYKWHKDIDPHAGMLRLVMGLGTRAVERTDGDYPRIVSLNEPQLMPLSSAKKKNQYSQHNLDVLDFDQNALVTVEISALSHLFPDWYKQTMIEHDFEAEQFLRERGRPREVVFSTCEGLTKNDDFTETMKQIMSAIQTEYDYPVDIEFTINFGETGDFIINLLQCRPLQIGGNSVSVALPKIPKAKVFFELAGGTMGGAMNRAIDVVIQVDPRAYYEYPYKKKHNIARIIGRINQFYKGKDAQIMLLAPGRIGTTSPELGVPVVFAEISNINIACEVAYNDAGYMPELSYGSHFFQDLVEAGIFYASIFEDENTPQYQPDFFASMESILEDICPGDEDAETVIKLYDVSNLHLYLFSDLVTNRSICGIIEKKAKI
ncbi:MAG: PEP/pyruvate-binding domain-containing protein [Clostridia bacterium]